MSKPDEPAFPIPAVSLHQGMSLRDYFAAAALPALVSDGGYATNKWPGNLAEDAYKVADAMLERSKP